jgi:hypothetical protein
VRFGEQYRQWNAAFDAGYAAALGKPLITLHPSEHDHALKEVDRAGRPSRASPSRWSRSSATRSPRTEGAGWARRGRRTPGGGGCRPR